MQASAQLKNSLKVALLTSVIDVAEELAADHIDEVIPSEPVEPGFWKPLTPDEETQRSKLAAELAFDTFKNAIIQAVQTLGDVLTFEDLRAKYSRHALLTSSPDKEVSPEIMPWDDPSFPAAKPLQQNPEAQELIKDFLHWHDDYRAIRREIAECQSRSQPIPWDYALELEHSDKGLLAQAVQLAEALRDGTIVLPGGDRDRMIQELRRDVELQGKMIDLKNEQSQRQYAELHQARERLAQLEEAKPIPEPRKMRTEYLSLMNDMSTPSERKAADAELQKLKNSGQGWKIKHIKMMSWEEGYTRYVLLQRKTADTPQPEPEKTAKAQTSESAAKTVPEPVKTPVIDHTIIIGDPAPVPVLNRFPIAQAIATHGVQAVKQSMNQQAIAAGVNAATARLAELTCDDDDEPLQRRLLAQGPTVYTDFLVR